MIDKTDLIKAELGCGGPDPQDPTKTMIAWHRQRDKTTELNLGENGELNLPERQKRRWGFEAGTKVLIEETPEGIFVRRRDPVLSKVYVEPTNACNLNCRTCVRRSWDEPTGMLDMDAYRRLIEDLKRVPSLSTVAFWGIGEPLLHPNIAEMVSLASALGAETEMISNGLLLDREVAKGLIEAGLNRLIVSVDGTSPEGQEDIRPGAALDTLKDRLEDLRAEQRRLNRNNPELGIEFVLMRRNLDELPHLRSIAYTLGASFIFVSNVIPYTEEMSSETLYSLSAATAPTFRSPATPEISFPRVDARGNAFGKICQFLQSTHLSTDLPGTQSPHANFTDNHCRFVNEGSAAISWDGAVSPCVPLMHSYTYYVRENPQRIRRYVMGNINNESITDIWAKEEVRQFRARVVDFKFPRCMDCGGCELLEANEEDCQGNPFPVCGNCLWAQGVIQCP